ncbi:hypothetical protein PP175_29215 (plasmid) [Aneurinibacillus sp. Ricciae_BoGa-3]|uniref:hypothetical protein n=1 Tax=Aneurinibacillus sp. Ricciae_BoGa-3 TaxID=3022697 RepID=UPI002340BC16|nr:hypothetical protein [Aneurinibacillus sp. Ricciae_BoGa-3]WCK57273.1 hypothetical protein PP175_29215 [Aneurinibacillus sp. Ricciae_BoGa-3]
MEHLVNELKKENEELKSCLRWMMDCYKATLWNKPVRNLDEVFSYADSLLKENKDC